MIAATVIEDDAECVKILADQGLLNALNPREGSRVAYVAFQRDGRSCLAAYHFGYEDDNGYVIVMMPKEMPREEAAAFFTRLITEHGGTVNEFVDVSPVNCN